MDSCEYRVCRFFNATGYSGETRLNASFYEWRRQVMPRRFAAHITLDLTMWRIEFSSAEFLPYLPEESQANPGVYGYELAHWLSGALARRGVVTSYPLGEDWGWLIEYIEGDLEVTIGCASIADEGEGYSGKSIAWSVFVKPHQSIKKFFGRRQEVAIPALLTAAIEAALAEKSIEVRGVEA